MYILTWWWTQQILHLVGLPLSLCTGVIAEHEDGIYTLLQFDIHNTWIPAAVSTYRRGTDSLAYILAFSAGWLLVVTLISANRTLLYEFFQQVF